MQIRQAFISLHAYLGQVLCGYMIGEISLLITILTNSDETPLPDVISINEAMSLASFSFYPTLSGVLLSGYLSNKMGRKRCLMLGGIIIALGHIIPLLYLNLQTFQASRAVSSFGSGIITVAIIVYLTEIASNNNRGSMLARTQLFNALGITLAIYAEKYMSVLESYYVGLAIALAFTLGTYFIPESPILTLMQGKDDEAKVILNTLGRSDDHKQLILNEDKKINYLKLFTVKRNLKTLFILYALFVFHNSSGIIAFYLYNSHIVSMVNNKINASIFLQNLIVVSSSVFLIFIDRVGRRILLIYSCIFCCIFQALIGLYFFFENGGYPVTEQIQWLPIVAMIGFFLFYFSGLAIIPTILAGEMLPSNCRSFGTAVLLVASLYMGHQSLYLHLFVVKLLGKYAPFCVYSIMCLAASVFSLLLLPETKGKSLVEIQLMLNK